MNLLIDGYIDSFESAPGRHSIGGWVSAESDGISKVVEALELDGQALPVSFFHRADLPEGRAVAFRATLSDEGALRLALQDQSICAVVQGQRQALKVWAITQKRFAQHLLLKEVDAADNETAMALIERLARMRRVEPVALATESPTIPVRCNLGMQSLDGSAVLGKDGYLFIHQGANRLADEYRKPLDEDLLSQWVSIMESRVQICQAAGARLLQVIVPEKQSVIPHFYPYSLKSPTALLAALNARFKGQDWYLDALSSLSRLISTGKPNPFRRVDSHFTVQGAEAMTRILLDRLGLGGLPNFRMSLTPHPLGGDLGSKFGLGDFLELTPMPDANWSPFPMKGGLVASHDPDQGRHIGTLRHWRNASAPIRKKVLIFGNSFFDRGVHPASLSYWFSHAFSETLFIWSADLDEQIIKDFCPDAVICQTVERFLPSPPKT